MKKMKYYEETNNLLHEFSEDNQQYFEELWESFNLAGFLYDEDYLREQIYLMMLDFSEAERDGMSAEDYLGKNPKKLMKEMLKEAPRSSVKESFLTPILVLAVLHYYQLLGDFSKGPLLTVNLLTFLGQLLLFLVGFGLVATILRWSLVQDSSKMKIGTYIVVGILVLLVVLGYVGIGSFVQEGAFYLPAPWDSFLVFTLSLVISIWNWKEAVFRPFVSMIVAHLVVGSLLRYYEWMGISNVFLTKIIPLAVLFIGIFVLFRGFKKIKWSENIVKKPLQSGFLL
ncbi:membrane protein [Streptococcus pseudopneumoniae G42]|nr:membrane protein [Streptococcus pseudopneumoniae G42]